MLYRTPSYAANTFDVFWYEKNLQGDIVAVYNSSGTKLVSYNYTDAWGNHSISYSNGGASTGAQYNPFRYRGYYYDTDLYMYYLQSRYYDSKICRFISADAVVGQFSNVQGANMFAYSFNNPVNMFDPAGNWPQFIDYIVELIEQVGNAIIYSLNEINYTSSSGVNVCVSPSIFTFNFQIGFSFDAKGNCAVQMAFSGGFTTGTPGASISMYNTQTNAPSIYHLEGMGYQIGGTAGVPVGTVPLMAGYDVEFIPDSNNNKVYTGNTRYVGVGTPGLEGHVTWGVTYTIESTRFNIYDYIFSE